MRQPMWILALGLALLGGACGSGEQAQRGVPYYDLVRHQGVADVEGETAEIVPLREPESKLLILPVGAKVEYLLLAQAESIFRAESVEVRGAGTRLEVFLETDEDGKRQAVSLSSSKQDLLVPLDLESSTAVRLVLQSVAGDARPGAGVALKSPALWAPAVEKAPQSSAVGETPSRRPNVLIYLVDTLRSDRLGCLGYSRPTTPHIDQFAESASLFLNAVGQSSWTKASVGSIFTGLWPPAHGAIGWKHKLSDDLETLAERLQAAGYRTAAFVTNPHVVEAFGFTQGFDEFTRKLNQPSDQVNKLVFEWIDGRNEGEEFLLYVHTMDPHAPYAPPEPFRSEFASTANQMPEWQPRWRWPMEALPYLSDLYDAEIAFNDDSFGELLGFLEDRGLYDETMILFASDHGEEFKEHGRWRHGTNLHAETLNFPLIVKFPDQRLGIRVEEPVQHIDLLPTILSNAGLKIPTSLEGRDLTALARGASSVADPAPSRIYSHLRLGRGPLSHSLVSGEWKLIRRLSEEGWEVSLFDWQEDPTELMDLASERPLLTAVLSAWLDQKVASDRGSEAVEEVTLSEEMEQDLRALGYLE